MDIGSQGCGPVNEHNCGYNIDTSLSEMAHLYYDELGKLAPVEINGQPQSGYGVFGNGGSGNYIASGDVGPFTAVQSTWAYWMNTPYAPGPGGAFVFYLEYGLLDAANKSGTAFWAWPVRVGDVAAVPLPAAAWLFGPALAILGARCRKLGRRFA